MNKCLCLQKNGSRQKQDCGVFTRLKTALRRCIALQPANYVPTHAGNSSLRVKTLHIPAKDASYMHTRLILH